MANGNPLRHSFGPDAVKYLKVCTGAEIFFIGTGKYDDAYLRVFEQVIQRCRYFTQLFPVKRINWRAVILNPADPIFNSYFQVPIIH